MGTRSETAVYTVCSRIIGLKGHDIGIRYLRSSSTQYFPHRCSGDQLARLGQGGVPALFQRYGECLGGGDEDRRQMWSGVWVVIEFQRVCHSKLSTVSHEDYYAFSVFTNLKIMRYLVSPKKSQKHLGSLK